MEDLQVTVAVKTGDSVAFGTVIWLRERRLCFEAHARTKETDPVELRMELRGRSDTVYAHGEVANKQKRQGAVPVFIVNITRMSKADEHRLKNWLEDIARGGTSANVEDMLTAQDVVASTSYSTSAHETANALKRYDEKRSRFRKKDEAEDDPFGLKSSKTGSSASLAGDAGRRAIRNALRKGVTTSRSRPKTEVRKSGDPASSAWLQKLHQRMDKNGEGWSHWEEREREASERRVRPAPTQVPAPLPPLPSVEPVSQDSEAASADEYLRWVAEMESASRSQTAAERADLSGHTGAGPSVPTADEMIGHDEPMFAPPPELAPLDEPSEVSVAPRAVQPEPELAPPEPEPVAEPEPAPPEEPEPEHEGYDDDDEHDPACFLDVDASSAMITWGEAEATRRDWTQQLRHGAFLLTVAPPHPALLSPLELVMALPDGQFVSAKATVVNAFAGGVGLQVEVSDEMRRVFAPFG